MTESAPRLALLARALLMALAGAIVTLAVVGGMLGFSPVPYWDMWDAHLAFFLHLPETGPGLWWSQHNEHRILLGRLLFYADLQWFDGAVWPLIVANHVLLLGSTTLFLTALRDAQSNQADPLLTPALGALLVAWLWSWMQAENLLWALQGKFFLAQLLPALALFLLYRSARAPTGRLAFVGACAAGVASLGTMANGMLALPLLTVLALVSRQSSARVVSLAALSVLGLALYLHDFSTVDRHGSLVQALRDNPFGLAHYVLLYLGSPFHYLSGGGSAGHLAAALAGGLLLGLTGWRGVLYLRGPRRLTIEAALLAYIVYIAATALATGAGRFPLGVIEQALSSRYTTPTLMAWAALLLLYVGFLARQSTPMRLGFLAVALLLGASLLKLQLQALNPGDTVFRRDAAGLALSLQIHDQERIQAVYPDAAVALPLAARARAAGLTVLAEPPFRDAPRAMEAAFPVETTRSCIGYLDHHAPLSTPTDQLYISGWVHAPEAGAPPTMVQILDHNGQPAGVAITGGHRPDVGRAVDPDAVRSGFSGYLRSDALEGPLTVQGIHGPDCRGALRRSAQGTETS